MEIAELRRLYKEDRMFLTAHCSLRLEQRGISEKDIENAINNGEIIEQYPDDYPWPSCLVLGFSDQKALHLCIGTSGEAEKLITAYWPDPEKWDADFKQRRES